VLDNLLLKIENVHTKENIPICLVKYAAIYIKLNKYQMAAHSLLKYEEWYRNAEHNIINSPVYEKTAEEAKNLLASLPSEYAIPHYNTNILTLEKGAILFVENETNDASFYVIKKGKVRISKLDSENEHILSILGEGEIFGEMAVLNQTARNATAIVFEEAEIIRLTISTFMEDVGDKVLLKIFQNLARRIWYSHQRVLLLKLKNPIARIYAYLQIAVSDYIVKSSDSYKSEFVFPFGVSDLKKMTGMPLIEDDEIEDFLTDRNIDISHHTIRVIDRNELDAKVSFYRSREK
jgi:CRP-like cAMP-binding protein